MPLPDCEKEDNTVFHPPLSHLMLSSQDTLAPKPESVNFVASFKDLHTDR